MEVLPQYKGVNLKDVKVESDLFEGMKFSKSRAMLSYTALNPLSVVASDPKSRTGDADKAELTKLYAFMILWHTSLLTGKVVSKRIAVALCR